MLSIAQLGLGYVGLLNTMYFALKGHDVICYDISQEVVDAVNSGNPKSGEFLSYISEDFTRLVKNKNITATTNFSLLLNKDAYFISVPTESKNKPLMDIAFSVIEKIVYELACDKIPLIIVESTVTPGFSQEIKRRLEKKHKYVDVDYFLAIAPRRDWFADPDKNLTNLPRVVGGLSQQSTDKASNVIKEVCSVINTTYCEIAEITKSLENTLLNVQVSTIEYLSLVYPHINVNEAIGLATKGHWRLSPLQLNSGIGGRCIPLALDYLREGMLNKLNVGTSDDDLFKIFRQTDLLYRNTICELIEGHIANIIEYSNDISFPNVVIFGLGYRKDFKDMGWSPGKYFYENLENYKTLDYNIFVHDPLFSEEEMSKLDIPFYSFNENKRWNILVLSTNHSYIYKNFNKMMKLSAMKNSVIIDTCGALDDEPNIEIHLNDIGIRYVRVGNANWKNI